jgi:threonine/homoserine/homoserine lactone efflux protein
MGFRFFKRVNLIPGLRVNLSQSGPSLSIGHRGGWFTIGPHGNRVTVDGLGTGLYYTERIPTTRRGSRRPRRPTAGTISRRTISILRPVGVRGWGSLVHCKLRSRAYTDVYIRDFPAASPAMARNCFIYRAVGSLLNAFEVFIVDPVTKIRRRLMTDPMSFALAVLLVLATPGPTNTLLATAAATTSLRHFLSLMPAELAGYIISIGTLLMFVRPLAETSALMNIILRGICACYLLYLAWTLWYSRRGQPSSERIGFRHVFITTLLNPKAAVFAFLIFPESRSSLWLQLCLLGIFIGICVVVCAGWLTLGAMIGQQAGSFVTPYGFQRGAAIALAIFAVVMLGSVLL